MKRIKVLLACNTLTSVHVGPYADHMAQVYRMARNHRNIDFHQCFARRLSIDRFRNFAATVALKTSMDYIFFIDDDMQFDKLIFDQLWEHRKKYHILAALNYVRSYPFDPMAYRFRIREDGHPKHLTCLTDEEVDAAQMQPIPVDAIGTAVCLIDVKNTIKKIAPPWFTTGPHNTEDIYFCVKAKDGNRKVRIGVHTGAITGHLLDPEVISYHTRKHLLAYHESYMSKQDIENARGTGDRGEGYVESVIEPGIREADGLHPKELDNVNNS